MDDRFSQINPDDQVPVPAALRTRRGGFTADDMTVDQRAAFAAWLDRNCEALVEVVVERIR